MDNSAESLFARAIEQPPGVARDEFLSRACGEDAALRREVESLVRAHEQAGDFLRLRSERVEPRVASQSTAIMNAASYAEAYLHGATPPNPSRAEAYVATLPEAVRREAQERIEAGLRVQQMRAAREITLPHEADVSPSPLKGERAGVRGEAARLIDSGQKANDESKAPIRSATPPPEDEKVLPRLPGFRIERELGAGSLGVVYAGYDEKLNRRVAIKVLRCGAKESVRLRVLEEARKAAALADPAVVTIFSVLDETDPPAIVMELVEGFSLDRFAAQLNFEQKANLLREVARGLAAAHEGGVIHRDLKPDNIIVGPDMRPRILDFGLAVSFDEGGRPEGGFQGTPLYASPEQVLGRALTAASDVFSFGSLMFKVLTGRPPFAGESFAEVFEAIASTAPPFLREVAVGVPEDLQAVCLACLAWAPADRPTAAEVALELGRFLAGEPVRLKPKLYDDLLRRSISEYSSQARTWESQSIISRDERDALEVVHRKLLADEDHWIIDARRITPLQTVLSAATWLAVVATVLTVWMLRDDLGPPWRWLLPAFFTSILLLAGLRARREGENLASATFLAGAALAIAPCTLALLAEIHLLAVPAVSVRQLFATTFTNQQVLVSSLMALGVSVFGLWRLRMTGFAWTTATLATTSYLGLLLLFDWLSQKPEIQALWCLPLAAMEPVALFLERRGRVRWTLPFHLVAFMALVVGLDVVALNGPTLKMLGLTDELWPYFDNDRQAALSFVINGLFFLILMLASERAASLDLRRAGKLLEVLAILHTLSALFANALNHRNDPLVRVDVWLYVSAALGFALLAPFRSRWRLLVGGLAGCGLGSYLLVDLGLVARKPFIIGLGFAGLFVALGTFAYLRWRSGARTLNR